jgi:hypothetical protein
MEISPEDLTDEDRTRGLTRAIVEGIPQMISAVVANEKPEVKEEVRKRVLAELHKLESW